MNTIFFSLMAIFSLFVFMNLGKIKASKKQTDRDDRINWGGRQNKNVSRKKNDGKIIEGEAEEVDDQSKK
jgi:hypothetical protein